MSPGVSGRMLPILPMRPAGRHEQDPYLMRLLQAKGTMGGRPPARTSRPAVSDGSKPAASLEAFRRIVGNMPRINQQQRQSDSQEAPEQMLSSPFRGPQPSMARVPEETAPLPAQPHATQLMHPERPSSQPHPQGPLGGTPSGGMPPTALPGIARGPAGAQSTYPGTHGYQGHVGGSFRGAEPLPKGLSVPPAGGLVGMPPSVGFNERSQPTAAAHQQPLQPGAPGLQAPYWPQFVPPVLNDTNKTSANYTSSSGIAQPAGNAPPHSAAAPEGFLDHPAAEAALRAMHLQQILRGFHSSSNWPPLSHKQQDVGGVPLPTERDPPQQLQQQGGPLKNPLELTAPSWGGHYPAAAPSVDPPSTATPAGAPAVQPPPRTSAGPAAAESSLAASSHAAGSQAPMNIPTAAPATAPAVAGKPVPAGDGWGLLGHRDPAALQLPTIDGTRPASNGAATPGGHSPTRGAAPGGARIWAAVPLGWALPLIPWQRGTHSTTDEPWGGSHTPVQDTQDKPANERVGAEGHKSGSGAACEAKRWWQDPNQVFGPAAVPEALAQQSGTPPHAQPHCDVHPRE
ncbi:hypothetical protein WJX84_000645 [Apatococcus fuscideae]|uniref:Uncharacterized protein n=1 Tax=Apatococcus fuscideae TaxID=2026836 RepID=A0AAW1SQZ5_9CHLO